MAFSFIQNGNIKNGLLSSIQQEGGAHWDTNPFNIRSSELVGYGSFFFARCTSHKIRHKMYDFFANLANDYTCTRRQSQMRAASLLVN